MTACLFVSLLAFSSFGAMPVDAATSTATWDGGGGDGLWSTAANWSGDVLPSSTSAVVIGVASAVVHLDTNFTLSGSGELRVEGFGASAPRLIIDSGRTLTFDNPGQILNRVEGDATIENNGTVQVNTEFRAQLLGNFLNNAGAVLNIGSATAFATFEASGLPTDDTLVNHGTVNLRGTLRISSIVRNYGTLNITGGGISVRGLANTGTLRNEVGGTLTGVAGTSITIGDPQFTSADTMVNAGSATFAGTLTLHRAITNTGTFNNTGGSTVVACGANILGGGTFTFGTLTEGCKLWDGEAGDGLWSSAANWSLNTLPTGSQNIRIDGSNMNTLVHLDLNFTLGASRSIENIGASRLTSFQNTLTVDAGVTLTNNGSVFNRRADFVNAGTVASAGTFANEGHPSIEVANFTNDGAFTNTGTFTNQGSSFSSLANVEQYGLATNNGTFTNSGTIENRATLTNAGSIVNTGTFNNTGIFVAECGSSVSGNQPSAGSRITDVLCVPVLVAPAGGAVVDTSTPSFTWSANGELRTVTYDWQLLDASGQLQRTETTSQLSLTSAAPIADGAYQWRVVARLGTAQAQSVTNAFTLDTNAAPVIDQLSLPTTTPEGASTTLGLTFHDPDPGDTVTVVIDWGDGAVQTTNAATSPLAATHAYSDGPAAFTATITATDADGETATYVQAIAVTNVGPTVITAGGSIDEGTAFSGSGSFTDPGADTWTATIDHGTGPLPLALASDRTFGWTRAYDDNGTFDTRIAISDDDGATGSTVATVAVRNVPPSVTATNDGLNYWGVPIGLIGTATDPSAADTAAGLIGAWQFGDGTAGSGLITSHAYATPGVYSAAFTATDKDGGTSPTATTAVTVERRGTSLTCLDVAGTFGFAVTLEATLRDSVSGAVVQGATIEWTLDGVALVGSTTPATAPGPHVVGAAFVGNTLYTGSSATCSFTVGNSVGKITSGLVRFEGKGRGGFNVQNDPIEGLNGELQFQNAVVDLRAHQITAIGIAPDKKSGWFAALGTNGERVLVYVEDNGEPGTADVVKLWIGGISHNGDGGLSGGNVQIH